MENLGLILKLKSQQNLSNPSSLLGRMGNLAMQATTAPCTFFIAIIKFKIICLIYTYTFHKTLSLCLNLNFKIALPSIEKLHEIIS
jgi:hypothetical protein